MEKCVSFSFIGWLSLIFIIVCGIATAIVSFIVFTKTPHGNYNERGHKKEESYHAALFLPLVEPISAIFISAMPVCQSLIVLVSVLLCAMLVAHYSSASSVKSVETAASHGLVAIPVSLSITRFSIFQANLAVHSWAQRISVLSPKPVHVSRSNNDWLWVLMVNLFTSLIWLACCISSVNVSDNWGSL